MLSATLPQLIQTRLSEMTPTERRLAQYVLENQHRVIYATAREVAREIGTSDASVVRFCQLLGFSGFRELKLHIALDIQRSEFDEGYRHISSDMPARWNTLVRRLIDSIQDTQKLQSVEIVEQVADYILGAKRLYLLGMGTSGVVARDAQLKLARLGFTAIFDDQAHNMAVAMALATADDVVIAFSHSGNTAEIANLLRVGRAAGARTIAITNNPASIVAKTAEIVLLTAADEVPFHSFATTSRIAQLVVIDLLMTTLLARLGSQTQERLAKIAAAITSLTERDDQ
jgi:DNA-binding MurR/RpiR family transcriptional regulator